jgi:hypothetical protein
LFKLPPRHADNFTNSVARRRSVTPTVLPTRPPALFPLGAVKSRLSELPVDFIMRLAEPIAKFTAAPNLGPVRSYIGLEVLGTPPARVQLGEELHKVQEIRLLR